jgi:hypothetical protein
MKRLSGLVVSATLLIAPLVSHAAPEPKKTATLTIYRTSKFVYAARNYWITINGQQRFRIRNKSAVRLSVPEGPLVITSKFAGLSMSRNKVDRTTLDIAPRSEYFIRAECRATLGWNKLELTEVPKTMALRDLTHRYRVRHNP